MKRLRLRGDWSDTGPLARPAIQNTGGAWNLPIQQSLIFGSESLNYFVLVFLEIGQARPTLHSSLLERMTLVLSQMLHETPQTAASAAHGGSEPTQPRTRAVSETEREVPRRANRAAAAAAAGISAEVDDQVPDTFTVERYFNHFIFSLVLQPSGINSKRAC